MQFWCFLAIKLWKEMTIITNTGTFQVYNILRLGTEAKITRWQPPPLLWQLRVIIYLFIYLFVCLFVCLLFVHLFIYLFIYSFIHSFIYFMLKWPDPTISCSNLMVQLSILADRKIILGGGGNSTHPLWKRRVKRIKLNICKFRYLDSAEVNLA